jgi:phospholipase/lecithinase/hemolysin
MRRSQLFLTLLFLALSFVAEARVFVLGDSLSDAGALYATDSSSKRFTYTDPNIQHNNGTKLGGKVWSEYISDPATKYPAYTCLSGYSNIALKHNLAVGGSLITASSGDAQGCYPSDLTSQINALPLLGSNDTVIIWIGANDIFQAAYKGKEGLVNEAVQIYLDGLTALNSRCTNCKIWIISVPHLAYTPEAQFVKKGFAKTLNRLTDSFNNSISDAINSGTFGNTQFFDINPFYDQFISGQLKGFYGQFVSYISTYNYYCHFTDPQASIDPSHICTQKDPSQPYNIFADLVHPSSYMHHEIYHIFQQAGVIQ